MARFLRTAERRQGFLLPVAMQDWLPEDDSVHLIVAAVSLMDLSEFEAGHRLGGAGQAPFAPQMLRAVLIYACSPGARSSRSLERRCGRAAGYRFIVGEPVPDHSVIARLRRRHLGRLEGVFLQVLEMCRDAGLIRLGLVVLDGTKVKASAALEANRSAATVEQQIGRRMAEAETVEAREDGLFGAGQGAVVPKELARGADRLSRRQGEA
jgi:transposase